MRIVFWDNCLSPHRSAMVRALAQAGHETELIASEKMIADRLRQGWRRPISDERGSHSPPTRRRSGPPAEKRQVRACIF